MDELRRELETDQETKGPRGNGDEVRYGTAHLELELRRLRGRL
jgi:hypothetical protein